MLTDCPGCHQPADPAGPLITKMHGGRLWHFLCMDPRARLGLDESPLPPMGRKAKSSPAKPLSMDPEGIRRLRGN